MNEVVCFTEDTLIATKDGYMPIKEIKVGDQVYSQNADTGEKGLKKVKNVFVNESHELIHICVGDMEIKATPSHPFWIIGKGWTPAGELKQGDTLLLYSDETAEFTALEKEKLENPIKVYNFEVEDWHTYFVSQQGILVHNTCIIVTPQGVALPDGRQIPSNLFQNPYRAVVMVSLTLTQESLLKH